MLANFNQLIIFQKRDDVMFGHGLNTGQTAISLSQDPEL